MRIDIISAVPELLQSPLNTSILKRAQQKQKVEIVVHNLRDYAFDKHRQIDDKPFGGEAGMLLKPEPFFAILEKLTSERAYDKVILTSPRGKLFTQKVANDFSLCQNIIFLAGHYKGIDDRVRERFATDEISVGDFVLTGGELPILLMVDAIIRLVPGVLNDSLSALNDSFQDGDNLSAPNYTRPAEYKGMKVPTVLLSGNHQAVQKWREDQSKLVTEKWKKNKIAE
ncbi:MAG: tRNA (guanosine(37)-N1)-methyltransferase TrmD [Ignavibacteria bacterium CG1_02_37_35]|nr:MAG: tRNA (guanosine(37)-N1)-methyltransferase TrmD [Ignavibacteria bacterium CG1_02_37_35]